MQIGRVLFGYGWNKPATLSTYLSREYRFASLQIGTLIIYTDWNKY